MRGSRRCNWSDPRVCQQAVEHAAAPGRTVLLQALRFRGGNTPVLLRRVVAAKAAAKATGGGAVIVANADAAEVCRAGATCALPGAR